MQIAGRLAQVLTCPLLPAGAVLYHDAAVWGVIADHAGPIMLVFTVAFYQSTAWVEARRLGLVAKRMTASRVAADTRR